MTVFPEATPVVGQVPEAGGEVGVAAVDLAAVYVGRQLVDLLPAGDRLGEQCWR